MKKTNIFWAILLIFAAACIILGQFNMLGGIGFWSIILTALFIAAFIGSIGNRSVGGVIFSLALLLIVWKGALYLSFLSAWAILGAALLLSIGLSMLAPKKKKNYNYSGNVSASPEETVKDPEMSFETSFGTGIKFVSSPDFKSARVDCSFGTMKVYFDGAEIHESAVVDAQVRFGNLELYIPRHWRVVNLMDTALAGFTEKNHPDINAVDATLTISGDAKFAGVTVIYV